MDRERYRKDIANADFARLSKKLSVSAPLTHARRRNRSIAINTPVQHSSELPTIEIFVSSVGIGSGGQALRSEKRTKERYVMFFSWFFEFISLVSQLVTLGVEG